MINNEALIDNNKNTIKKIILEENVILLPPRAFEAFTKWYGRTLEITRRVI